MSARERILGRLRRELGNSEERRKGLAEWTGGPRAPVPATAQFSGSTRVAHFLKSLGAMHGSYTQLESLDQLPAALSKELRSRNMALTVRMGNEAEFSVLDWSGIDRSVGPGRRDEPSTMTRAFCASAETGTLVLLSGPDNPVTLNFLGETHFVVLKASEIEAGFEGVWQRLRKKDKNPRTVNLITGPSRTADIEQQLELGAHGPIALHLFLIDDLQ